MSNSNDNGAEDLERIADEVERDRQQKGHTPFDDTDSAESPDEDGETREDHEGVRDILDEPEVPNRAGSLGAVGRVRPPGL